MGIDCEKFDLTENQIQVFFSETYTSTDLWRIVLAAKISVHSFL